MRIFISFAHEQSRIAESIYRKLLAADYGVFFASDDIRASDGYDERIRSEVAAADRLLFLASSDSLAEGKYTLTELGMFSRKWPDPTGRIMVVMLDDESYEDLPPYLGGVTSALKPKGDVASEVTAVVIETWPLRKLRAVLAGAVAVVALGLAAWAIFGGGNGDVVEDAVVESNNVRVKVTLDKFFVHKDGDRGTDGAGDIYWELKINGEIISKLPRRDRIEMFDNHTQPLGDWKEFDLLPGETLVLSGHITDRDSGISGRNDVVLFDTLLPVPGGPSDARTVRRAGHDGTPDMEVYYTIERVGF